MKAAPLVVLFDGDCVLCSASARWLAGRDRHGRMIFATNQGEAARVAGEPPGGDPDTVVVWQGARRLVRSDAVLCLLSALGGAWAAVAWAGRLCPAPLRDFLYDQLARRRRRFGGAPACKRLSPLALAE